MGWQVQRVSLVHASLLSSLLVPVAACVWDPLASFVSTAWPLPWPRLRVSPIQPLRGCHSAVRPVRRDTQVVRPRAFTRTRAQSHRQRTVQQTALWQEQRWGSSSGLLEYQWLPPHPKGRVTWIRWWFALAKRAWTGQKRHRVHVFPVALTLRPILQSSIAFCALSLFFVSGALVGISSAGRSFR